MNRLANFGGTALAAIIGTTFPAHSLCVSANDVSVFPLSEIVTTSPQDGLQTVEAFMQRQMNEQERRASKAYLRQLQQSKSGSTNVFLVDAMRASDAIAATASTMLGSRPADTPIPVNSPHSTGGSNWLVAYFGSGPSEPTWWIVESVTVEADKVRLTYCKPPPSPVTSDAHRYFYWIPLGTLAPGSYQLELFDSERELVTLMRRVDVSSANEQRRAR